MLNRKQYFETKTKLDSEFIRSSVTPKVLASLALSQPYFKMDADGVSFHLQRELTLLEAQAIEHISSEMTSRKLFTVENVGAGIQSINYAEILRTGEMAFSGEFDGQIPSANASRKETPAPVRKGKIKYTISLEEMEAMMYSNAPLDSQKALAAKEGTESKLNKTVWFGNKENGLKGLFNYLQDEKLVKVTSAVAGSIWSAKTADEIWADIVLLKKASEENTDGQIETDTLAVSIANYNILNLTNFEVNGILSSESILDRILKRGLFTKVIKCPELKDPYASFRLTGLTSGKSVAIAFSSRRDVFKIHHPLEFTTQPIEKDGMDYVVYCHANTAGLFLYRKYGGAFLINC